MKIKKSIICIGIFIIICSLPLTSAVEKINENGEKIQNYNFKKCVLSNTANYSNITVYEAWDFLTNTSNGIQIPVDVRRDDEWEVGFIDTPYPENPIHYILSSLQTETGLENFIDIYNNSEIIFYCAAGGRSLMATKILAKSNFTGKIYNMLGGIGAWNSAGFPIRTNKEPDEPDITGPAQGTKNKYYSYVFLGQDSDNDRIRYYIDWGDGSKDWTDFSEPGKPVVMNHAWSTQGTYIITCKTQDFYGAESNISSFSVVIPKFKTMSFSYSRFNNIFTNILSILQKIFY